MNQDELSPLVARLTEGETRPCEGEVKAAISAALASQNIDIDINRQLFSSSTHQKVRILAAILLIRRQVHVD